MPLAVDARLLGKTFSSRPGLSELLRGRLRGPAIEVLRAVDLQVGATECVAVLGENGAGKSTLLRCLGGLLSPTTGEVTVAGHDIRLAGATLRRDAAYIAGDARSFSWRISGKANLEFFAILYGLRGGRALARVSEVLDRVGLDKVARGRPVAEYSTGMRQRLALARGFLATPKVWLLDEPTAALDPRGAREVLDYIRGELGGHAAAIVATHSIEHARAVASRAVVLRDGRVVYDGSIAKAAALVQA